MIQCFGETFHLHLQTRKCPDKKRKCSTQLSNFQNYRVRISTPTTLIFSVFAYRTSENYSFQDFAYLKYFDLKFRFKMYRVKDVLHKQCSFMTRLMEPSFSRDTANSPGTQELPNIIRKSKVQGSLQEILAIIPIPRLNISVQATPYYFLKVHFNIIQPLTSWSFQWSFFGFLTNIYAFLFSIRSVCCAHLFLLYFILPIRKIRENSCDCKPFDISVYDILHRHLSEI